MRPERRRIRRLRPFGLSEARGDGFKVDKVEGVHLESQCLERIHERLAQRASFGSAANDQPSEVAKLRKSKNAPRRSSSWDVVDHGGDPCPRRGLGEVSERVLVALEIGGDET